MAILRVHLLQNWFGYSDSAIEEALHETTLLRQFFGLSLESIPDETTIFSFRRRLEITSWRPTFWRWSTAAGVIAACRCIKAASSMRP